MTATSAAASASSPPGVGPLFAYEADVIGLLFERDPAPFLARLGGDSRRWRVYRRMARRRLTDVLEHAFPRLASVLGDAWSSVIAAFLHEAPPRSPYIRDVAGELARWLEARRGFSAIDDGLAPPPWALDLARYESALIETSYRGEEVGARETSEEALEDRAQGARVVPLRMDRPAVLTPAHQLVRLGWSVHRFSVGGELSSVVEDAQTVCTYRDPLTHEVRVLELTPFAARLLTAVAAEQDLPLVDLVRRVAGESGAVIDAAFVEAFSDLVADLMDRGVWLGSLAESVRP